MQSKHLEGFVNRNQKEIKVIIFLFLLFLIAAIAIYSYYHLSQEASQIAERNEANENKIVVKKEEVSPTITPEATAAVSGWMVDIKGQVLNPGTYAVDDSMRIIDVIHLAGGLTEKADTSLLNLSKKVEDQMVIIIYTTEQVNDFRKIEEENSQALNECHSMQDACIELENPDEEKEIVSNKVDLNQATKEDLMTLPGVGEAKATAILAYRDEIGKFTTIEQLMEVPGIKDATYQQLKDFIVVS